MEAIGQLTGGLAHDFNNLLTVIIGNLELLEGKLPDDRSTKRLSEAISAARKGSDLTRQMLAFARSRCSNPAKCSSTNWSAIIAPLLVAHHRRAWSSSRSPSWTAIPRR